MNKTILQIPDTLGNQYDYLIKRLEGKKTYTNVTGKDVVNPLAEIFNKKEIQSLRDYEEYLTAFEPRNVSKRRRFNLIQRLLYSKRLFPNVDITKINETNVKKVLLAYEKAYDELAPMTIHGLRIALRKYLCWREYGDETLSKIDVEGYPKVVKMIPSRVSHKDVKKVDTKTTFTRPELRKIISSSTNVRNKAILTVLIETGARIGEIYNLKVKDLAYTSSPPMYILDLFGKTGHRQNSVQIYFKELNDWLVNHPLKDKPNFMEQPLWVYVHPSTLEIVPMKYTNFYRMIVKCVKLAGVTKPSNPHNFRHTFVTHKDQEGWSREDIGQWVGWSKSSRMFATYSHSTSEDVIQKKIGILGGKPKVYEADYALCSNEECKHINPKVNDTCWSCKSSLGTDSQIKYETIDSKIEDAIMIALKNYAMMNGHTEFGNMNKISPNEFRTGSPV